MDLLNFHDVRLPLPFALGGSGGPRRRTEVVGLSSGRERRSSLWSGSRRVWDIGGGVIDLDGLSELTAFFEARRGRLYGFGFRDVLDWKSCLPSQEPSQTDQLLGVGDGRRTDFPLVKRYGTGEQAYVRRIILPVPGSVRVGVRVGGGGQFSDGVAEGWSVESGVIRFAEAPVSGWEVRAGFRYDVPVRFDTDELQISIDTVEAGRASSVPLIELLGS